MGRRTSTGKAPDVVNCRGCDWHYEGMNGLGLAAQHHDRTGHTVDVDTFGFVTYGDPAAPDLHDAPRTEGDG